MTPYLLSNGSHGDAQAKIHDLFAINERLERELAAWGAELSKVMPLDFKDWWQNSKTEWPLVARLVIESKNQHAERDLAAYKHLEDKLAAERALADRLAETLAGAALDYGATGSIVTSEVDAAIAAWKEGRK